MLSLNSPFLRNTMRKNVKAKKERFTTTAKPTSIDVLQGNKFLHQGLTLDYIPPTFEEEVEVDKLKMGKIESESLKWKHALIRYVFGEIPQFKKMLKFVYGFWRFFKPLLKSSYIQMTTSSSILIIKNT